MSEILWFLWGVTSTAIETYSIFHYLGKQLEYLHTKKKWVIIAAVGCAIFNSLWANLQGNPFLLLALYYGLMLLFAFIIFSGSASQKILTSSICICVIVLSNVATSMIISAFVESDLASTLAPSVTRFAGTALYVAIVFFSLLLLSRRRKNELEFPIYLRVIVIVLVGVQVAAAALLLSFGYSDTGMAQSWLFLIFGFIIIALIPAMLLIIDMIGRTLYQKSEAEMQLALTRLTNQHAEDMLESEKSLSRFRHDFRNHMIALRGYLEQDDVAASMHYLDELDHEYSGALSAPIKTGKPFVDAILSQKNMVARAAGIKVSYTFEPIRDIPLSDVKLCSLLGNLWDNAIEACAALGESEKWIEFCMSSQRGMFSIVLSNSASGKYVYGKNAKIASSKGAGRGLGLEQVERTVHEAHGWTTIAPMEDRFTVSIFIPGGQADES